MHSSPARGAIGIVAVLLCCCLASQGASQAVVRPLGPAVTPARVPSVYEPAEPAARYGSYRAAGDSLRRIVNRALGSWARSARWKRTREPFDFVLHEADTTIVGPCLRMSYAFQDSIAPGYERIDDSLRQAGWVIDDQYDADGADGTRFVLFCREAMVEIDARWEGGDESDTTYVPPPGQTITLRCVPRPGRGHVR
jgi:hypothetical protein